MINIYIKSFNRPFYLDRCIRSIKQNLRGYERIIVLDDGTLQTYLKMISELHPDVEIRSSGADDGKMLLLRAEKFLDIAKRYPSAPQFWVREIGKDPYPYCVVLEDDVWMARYVNLPTLVENLEANQSIVCKFWWGVLDHRVTARYEAPGCPPIEYFEPLYGSFKQASSIWIVAFAVFRRDYWLHCVSTARRLADERSQLTAACEFAVANPYTRFAKTAQRCIYQGWVIPARSTPEYYDRGLRQHLYMDAINEAWAAGRLDPDDGYPYDFDRKTILAILSASLPEEAVTIWDEWHRSEIRYCYD
jgi:hypothetical protein